MTAQSLSTSTPIQTATWHWQGHKIQYAVQGSGHPLVLVHGFGASIGHWRKNIPVLAEAGYRVFALDLLGFGASDKPTLDYTVELWQQQLKDFWEAHIQEPTVFVGNSIGGLLTLMVVTEYPDIAAGGVLLNSAGGLNHRPDELNLPLRLLMGTFTKVVSAPVIGRFIFNRVRQKNRIRSTLRQVYRDRAAITDELVDIIYEPTRDPNAHQVFASVLSAPPGPKPAELLPKLQRPLLVLWGDEDPWTPITGAKIYQQLSENNEKVEFYPVPQAGHCPHDEKPELVNEQIINWLEKVLARE